jgi:hypothetical protein
MKDDYGTIRGTSTFEETGLCFITIDTEKKTLKKAYVNTLNEYTEELK